jgi:hypothetical protein
MTDAHRDKLLTIGSNVSMVEKRTFDVSLIHNHVRRINFKVK